MSSPSFPPGNIIWIEIPAVNVPTCAKFYKSLFPTWNFKPTTDAYPEERIVMFEFPKGGLSGGIVQVEATCKTEESKKGVGFTVYHAVESIEETKKQVEALGGKSVSEKIPEGTNGWFMYFHDPEGNRFGGYEMKKNTEASEAAKE